MVAKGNKDAHRYSVSGLPAVETEKFGRSKARELYGRLDYENTPPAPPKDMSQPQDRLSQAADKNFNDVPADSWLRGGGKGGEGYPAYDKGKK